MAIDPSIALQVKNPEINVAKTMTDAANAGSALVDAATKSRTLSAKKWYGANSDLWTKVDPTTKQPVIDYAELMKQAHLNNFGDLAPEIGQAYNQSVQSQLANSTSQQDLTDKKFKLANQGASILAQMIKSAATRGDVAEVARLQQSGPAHLQQIVGPEAVQGGIVPPQSDNPSDAVQWANDYANGSMTEAEHRQLAISNANLSIAQKQQWATAGQAAKAAVDEGTIADRYTTASAKIGSMLVPLGGYSASTYAEALNLSESEVNQMIQTYNLENGTNLTASSGKEAVAHAFKTMATKHYAMQKSAMEQTKILQRGSGVDFPTNPTPEKDIPRRPKIPSTETRSMVDQNGKIHKVNADDVEQLKSRGWKLGGPR